MAVAFKNIDVDRLRRALNNCKEELKHTEEDAIFVTLSNKKNWDGQAQKGFTTAIAKLTLNKYTKLTRKIDSYLGVVSDIEKYQELAETNEELESEISTITSRINNLTGQEDSDKSEISTLRNKKTKKKNKIEANKEKMKNLKNKVESAVN